MRIVDIDGMFREYLKSWMEENSGKATSDELEGKMHEVYIRFINERRPELDGLSPSEYFSGFSDAEELVRAMREYEDAGLDAPDLMLERVVEIGKEAVKPLMRLVMDEDACECLRATALNLLTAIGDEAPVEYCLSLIDTREDEDDLADIAAQFLQSLGEKPVAPMLNRLDSVGESALCTYLDILCNFPGDERIYIYTMREFITNPDKRAMYAALLGKLGDERAIKALTAALDLPDVNYLDYLEIRNSIEMLGGEVNHDRVYDGDRYYETLKNIE
ncbi:MAG: hypothetical protein Q4D04_02055 [Clostridia bacterium]|nr:hypothetical protein [Clostridia bacterium]